MTSVRIMPGFGKRDPTAMLDVAKNADLVDVTIIGVDQFGERFFSSSYAHAQDVVYDLAKVTNDLLRG